MKAPFTEDELIFRDYSGSDLQAITGAEGRIAEAQKIQTGKDVIDLVSCALPKMTGGALSKLRKLVRAEMDARKH